MVDIVRLLIASLLLLPAYGWGASAAHEEPSAPNTLFFPDPAGDVTNPPLLTINRYLDVRSFEIGNETPGAYEARFRFVAAPEPATTVGQAYNPIDLECSFYVIFNSTPSIQYRFFINAWNYFSPGGMPTEMQGAVFPSRNANSIYVRSERPVFPYWDAAEGALVTSIPKDLIMPSENNFPSRGDHLQVTLAQCGNRVFRDSVNVAGGRFHFQEPGNEPDVYVHVGPVRSGDVLARKFTGPFPAAYMAPLGLTAGRTTVVPVTIKNLDSVEANQRIDVTVRDGDGAVMPWRIETPNHVKAALGETVSFDAAIDVPSEVSAGQMFVVQVDARPANGTSSRGARQAEATPPLAPQGRLHFLHSRLDSSDLDVTIEGVDWHEFRLSSSPHLPLWDRRPVQAAEEPLHANGWCDDGLSDVLGQGLQLDPLRPIELRLASSGGVGKVVADYEFRLRHGQDVIADWAGTFLAGQEAVTVPLSLGAPLKVPAHDRLSFEICFGPGADFDPAQSYVELPVVE